MLLVTLRTVIHVIILRYKYGMHVSVSEVLDLLRGQPNDKATSMDGLSGEILKFADLILAVLLSICFTCMFKHCYLPSSMLDSVVVPLVKNINGDLSGKNNYRPIALSSTISKAFENVILSRRQTTNLVLKLVTLLTCVCMH